MPRFALQHKSASHLVLVSASGRDADAKAPIGIRSRAAFVTERSAHRQYQKRSPWPPCIPAEQQRQITTMAVLWPQFSVVLRPGEAPDASVRFRLRIAENKIPRGSGVGG